MNNSELAEQGFCLQRTCEKVSNISLQALENYEK